MLVVAPVEIGVHHGRFHGVWGRVERVHAGNVVRALEPIRVEAFIAVDVAFDSFRVGVEQQLVRVEAVALLGPIGAMHTVAVEQAGAFQRQIAVPDEIGLLRHDDALEFTATVRVEQTQFDLRRVLRKEREIHALAVPRGTQGEGLAGSHRACGFDHEFVHCDAPIV